MRSRLAWRSLSNRFFFLSSPARRSLSFWSRGMMASLMSSLCSGTSTIFSYGFAGLTIIFWTTVSTGRSNFLSTTRSKGSSCSTSTTLMTSLSTSLRSSFSTVLSTGTGIYFILSWLRLCVSCFVLSSAMRCSSYRIWVISSFRWRCPRGALDGLYGFAGDTFVRRVGVFFCI